MSEVKIIGTCSRCSGPVMTQPNTPATCSKCKGVASNFGPIIEITPQADNKQLLLETK